MIVLQRFHRHGGKEHWIQKYNDWNAPLTDPLEWTQTVLGTRLQVIRWLPDTSDPFLLSRLQAEYKQAVDWYAHNIEGYRGRVPQAQKRLAQAIAALAAEP